MQSRGSKSSQRPQRQRNLRLHIKRRMAACKHQSKPVIFTLERSIGFNRLLRDRSLNFIPKGVLILTPCSIPAAIIDELAARRSRNPGSRIFGNPLRGPVNQGGGKSILQRLFSQIEGFRDTNQGCNNTAALAAKNRLDCSVRLVHSFRRSVPISRRGRTSTYPGPPWQEVGIFAAHSNASSKSRQSRM